MIYLWWPSLFSNAVPEGTRIDGHWSRAISDLNHGVWGYHWFLEKHGQNQICGWVPNISYAILVHQQNHILSTVQSPGWLTTSFGDCTNRWGILQSLGNRYQPTCIKGDTGFGTKTAAVGFLETLRPSDFELFETCWTTYFEFTEVLTRPILMLLLKTKAFDRGSIDRFQDAGSGRLAKFTTCHSGEKSNWYISTHRWFCISLHGVFPGVIQE